MRRADKDNAAAPAVVARDLSPIEGLSGDDQAWLAELVRRADTDTLTLPFADKREVEDAPLAYFEPKSGKWWAGRFVGEVTFAGRTLTILPRFGMAALRRWLGRAWGVRLLASTGSYAAGRVWLWELLARLWSDRLVTAAQHGLPRARADETHVGRTVRGRLLIAPTAANLHVGRQALVSRTRVRRLDPVIGGILLGAFDRLRRELGRAGDDRAWLTERGVSLVQGLRAELDHRAVAEACRTRAAAVRYTPITEGYRPAVQLSRVIIGGRPFTSSSDGDAAVYGVLLDMAELWELYVFHLVKDSLPHGRVVHAGRSAEAAFWLLTGSDGRDRLAALKPDILVGGAGRRLVLDAKYKLTTPGPGRPQGVQREDLYQMAAYLSVASGPAGELDGGLVYPASPEIGSLQQRGPYRLARTGARLSFLGLGCDGADDGPEATDAELAFIAAVRSLAGGHGGSVASGPLVSTDRLQHESL